MVIAIDFDGTCVTHEYPNIGESIGAEEVLCDLVETGHKLILFTMRSGDKLSDAVGWFEKNSVPLYGINKNPVQGRWTDSPKAYAQLYIDDAALGCPLSYKEGKRPYVDWSEVKRILIKKQIL